MPKGVYDRQGRKSSSNLSRSVTKIERVWQETNKTGEHWLWHGAVNNKGYGSFSYDGKVYSAHVVVYEHYFGAVLESLVVMHSCDIPNCVTPEHLRCGTYSDNLEDAIIKGRHTNPVMRGEANPSARLTADDVRTIRALHTAGQNNVQIAAHYRLDRGYVWRITTHRNWTHIP